MAKNKTAVSDSIVFDTLERFKVPKPIFQQFIDESGKSASGDATTVMASNNIPVEKAEEFIPLDDQIEESNLSNGGTGENVIESTKKGRSTAKNQASGKRFFDRLSAKKKLNVSPKKDTKVYPSMANQPYTHSIDLTRSFHTQLGKIQRMFVENGLKTTRNEILDFILHEFFMTNNEDFNQMHLEQLHEELNFFSDYKLINKNG